MSNIFKNILQKEPIISLLKESEKRYILSQLKLPYDSDLNDGEVTRLSFFLFNSIFSIEDTDLRPEIAYKLIKSIEIESEEGLFLFDEVYGIEGVNPKTLYYFYLANIALKSDRLISIRVDLEHFSFGESSNNAEWKDRLLNKALEAYILLVRKQKGFSDIESALNIVENLKKEQQEYETAYL